MLRISRFFFFSCFLFTLLLHGQNKSIVDKVKPAFKSYFAFPRASIFLHLNKSTFVLGEHIWFKGYLYNRLKRTPLDEPLNLYVGIYNDKGDQLQKKLFSSKDGFALGQIKIDSTFKPGAYYIKAQTNAMRNFEESGTYIQKFTVVGGQIDLDSKLSSLRYDVQFLPESGHWIADVQSTIGIKVINQFGYGTSGAKGVVKNNKGRRVADFETNAFGLAKIKLIPELGLNYFAEISFFDGTRNVFSLPKVEAEGINLQVRHVKGNKVFLLFGTNSTTMEKMGANPLSVLIHRDGLLKKLDLKFSRNEFYVSFVLGKEDLFPGMNIITLIDNNGTPIAERLLFNHNNLQTAKAEITRSKINSDSVSVEVSIPQYNGEKCNLSISVLPSATKAYYHRKNSLSSFLLEPYLKGFVENPAYYFKNVTFKKEKALDLLLLTQGWSSYDWDVIFNGNREMKYAFARGVTLTGKVSSKLRENDKLLYYANKGALPSLLPLGEGADEFKMHNYFPLNGTEIQFSIIQDNGTFTRPAMYVTIENNLNDDRVYNTWPENTSPYKNAVLGYADLPELLPAQNTIRLDEVTVTETRRPERFITPQVFQNKLKKVSSELERTYPSLLDLIRSNGYNVAIDPNGNPWNPIQISTRRPLIFSSVQPSPLIYINDIRQHDFQFLLDFPTTKIESFYIDRTGAGEHGGAGGVIRVYTRDEGTIGADFKIRSNNAQKKFFKYIISKGFEPAKRFYAPKYVNIEHESFENFGVIHWEPQLLLDSNGNTSFKIPNMGVDTISFFIEGMSEEGTLFSSKQLLKITSD